MIAPLGEGFGNVDQDVVICVSEDIASGERVGKVKADRFRTRDEGQCPVTVATGGGGHPCPRLRQRDGDGLADPGIRTGHQRVTACRTSA